jgi:hypothetical protein
VVDLELALERAHAEVKRLREQVSAAEDRARRADDVASFRQQDAKQWAKAYEDLRVIAEKYNDCFAAMRESHALLTEALPDIRRRSASRAARIDVHLVRLRSLLP